MKSRPHDGKPLPLALAFGLVAMLPILGCRPAPEPPSIVLIVADTLRADYLGLYGFDGDNSPNLDRLAQESVVFERCYSQAPWTKPAIASLLTGMHPTRHGVLTHFGYGAPAKTPRGKTLTTDILDTELVTLAERLSEAGYTAGAFVANPWIRADHGFAQGFDHFDRRHAGNTVAAGALVDAALAWLATLEADERYFLYLHLMDPHGPYDAPEEDYEAVAASPSLGEDVSLSPAQFDRIFSFLRRPAWALQPGGRSLRTWRGRYAAGVRAFDQRIAPLLDRFVRGTDTERTLVVVTSDHGEELHEHGGWAHGMSLHDHQLRVPLLVRLPGGENGGRRVDEVVSLVDVLPTLLRRAGMPVPARLDGEDLSPLVRPPLILQQPEPPRASYASSVVRHPATHSIATGHHKLIEDRSTGELQLFDLAADPAEQTNLAAELPEIATALQQRLRERVPEASARSPGLAPVSSRTRERLRALGYEE